MLPSTTSAVRNKGHRGQGISRPERETDVDPPGCNETVTAITVRPLQNLAGVANTPLRLPSVARGMPCHERTLSRPWARTFRFEDLRKL